MNNLFNVLNIYCVNYIFIVICSIFDNGFFFFFYLVMEGLFWLMLMVICMVLKYLYFICKYGLFF